VALLLAVDLHTHSTRSDGTLAPAELVRRAHDRGVSVLALTDHDDMSGIAEAREKGLELGVHVLPGVEVSVTWHGATLHVLGLGIDPQAQGITAGLAEVRSGRMDRARAIAARLEAAGVVAPLEGALRFAANDGMVGRVHFARLLVERGLVRDTSAAFRRFLGEGKPGHVRHRWPGLDVAVGWIRDAGGVAVLAHPARYGLRTARMRALLDEFRALGGEAVEVVTGNHTPDEQGMYARLAEAVGLHASAGSDFHGPGESWWDVGQLPDLPAGCEPVWHGRAGWMPARA
jgi:predicted metal-dependent phosphoesterase TrpH